MVEKVVEKQGVTMCARSIIWYCSHKFTRIKQWKLVGNFSFSTNLWLTTVLSLS